jgi:hypothetical protein
MRKMPIEGEAVGATTIATAREDQHLQVHRKCGLTSFRKHLLIAENGVISSSIASLVKPHTHL